MTDHAKCRVCGKGGAVDSSASLGLPFEDGFWVYCTTGWHCVTGPCCQTEELAWAAWDELMRPAIPEPLRELVRAARAWQPSGADEHEEALDKAIDALPPELLAACLKETDDD
jgi:hypothetical protein